MNRRGFLKLCAATALVAATPVSTASIAPIPKPKLETSTLTFNFDNLLPGNYVLSYYYRDKDSSEWVRKVQYLEIKEKDYVIEIELKGEESVQNIQIERVRQVGSQCAFNLAYDPVLKDIICFKENKPIPGIRYTPFY